MKKFLLILLSLLIVAAITSCGTEALPEMTALADWQSYKIIRTDRDDEAAKSAAINFRSTVESTTGIKLELETDWVKRGESTPVGTREILIGSTNRPESECELLLEDWEIEFVGGRVAIRAGSDEMLAEAVDWFLANCVSAEGISVPAEKYTQFGDYPLKDIVIGANKLSDYSIDDDSRLASLHDFIADNTGSLPSDKYEHVIRYVQSDEIGKFEARVSINGGDIELSTNKIEPDEAIKLFMNMLENRKSDELTSLDLREEVKFSTRSELAKGVYAAYHLADLSVGEFAELTDQICSRLDELNSLDFFVDLDYKAELGRELWFTAALGFFSEFDGANIEPERELTDKDSSANIASDKSFDLQKLEKVFDDADSELAKASALFLYKKARAAVFSESLPKAERDKLYTLLEKVKTENRDFGAVTTITGSPDDEIGYIYSYKNGPFVRNVTIESNKPDSYPIEIVMMSDTHYNLVNDDDFAEANPSVMSTYEGRTWLKNGASVKPVDRALEYADYSDLTVVAGDILDFLSLGCQELAVNNMFRRDLDMLAAPGGHDITRVMQGKVDDPTSKESRTEILETFWPSGFHYDSKILGDKVMAITLDNDSGYKQVELELLKADLELARENDLIVLIFQHEPICTSNPEDTKVPYIRAGDASGSFDFSPTGGFIGAKSTGGVSREIYELIRSSSDVIKAIFCGHWHNDMYTEILTPDGGVIPQYVSTACVYDNAGHVIKITVK